MEGVSNCKLHMQQSNCKTMREPFAASSRHSQQNESKCKVRHEKWTHIQHTAQTPKGEIVFSDNEIKKII